MQRLTWWFLTFGTLGLSLGACQREKHVDSEAMAKCNRAGFQALEKQPDLTPEDIKEHQKMIVAHCIVDTEH